MNDTAEHVGGLVKLWRQNRRLSQEQLAERAEVSTRHLSFIETGKARPSRETLLTLMNALEIPLRDRNVMLLTAGWAPVYRASPLDGSDLREVRRALDYILRQQEPYPAMVLDRLSNLVQLNRGASRLLARFLPPGAAQRGGSVNVLEAVFDPAKLRPFIVNWRQVAGLLLARLTREVTAVPGDTEGRALLARLLAHPDLPSQRSTADLNQQAHPFVPVRLRRDELELQLFTTLTTLGTPLDITAEELRIESYFPADDASERLLRSWADAS
jgi:transcriptional regulator with XRE-family HTH domain